MLCVGIVAWSDWGVQERIMGALCILLPLHVFEELAWPAGFPFMMNKLIPEVRPATAHTPRTA